MKAAPYSPCNNKTTVNPPETKIQPPFNSEPPPPSPPVKPYPKYSQHNERDELEEVPLVVVVGVEEDQVAGEVWVHQLQREGRSEGSEERSPHHLVREVVGDLVGGQRVTYHAC